VTPQKVGILSPGDMGSGTGAILAHYGLQVYTCLAGRSELTRLRAREAGFQDLPDIDTLAQEVDLLLSILVPSEAVRLGADVAAALKRTGARIAFADCNAISPGSVKRIAASIEEAGSIFIDGGIIGGPPRVRDSAGTVFYVSGADTAAMEALGEGGLNVRVVGPEIGQASGLKMVYAASTKGTTALWTELLAAARALGLQDQLMKQFEASRSGVSRQVIAGIPSMPRRARRWVGEMEEIAATFSEVGLTPRILEGAADMYRLVGGTPLADQTSREPDPDLDALLGALVEKARDSA
jgi:3-hydroxyisobutyrate dehydrogenase-like beta-hydroxyacid dehydrogenase